MHVAKTISFHPDLENDACEQGNGAAAPWQPCRLQEDCHRLNAYAATCPDSMSSCMHASPVEIQVMPQDEARWLVCLDAAKACASSPPDLSTCPADFVVSICSG